MFASVISLRALALLRSVSALFGDALRRGRQLRAVGADQRGQTTAEYALVLLAAASVALALVAWAAKSGKVGELFDAVVDSVIDKV